MSMNGVFSSCLVCILLVLPGVLCQQNLPLEEWTTSDYPHNLQNPEWCGREDHDEPIYVCDPNNLLQESEAQQLDVLIEEVMNDTSCPCGKSVCDKDVLPGYRIGVALMKKMKIEDDENNDDGKSRIGDTIAKHMEAARHFAFSLLSTWQLGRCEEEVIILYSEQDTVLYTVTAAEAELKLKSYLIGETSLKVKGYMSPTGNRFEGLRPLISDYKAIFRGEYEGMEFKTATPRYQPAVGRGCSVIVPSLFLLIVAIFVTI